MKKVKMPLRLTAILMACIMTIGTPISAFAGELSVSDSNLAIGEESVTNNSERRIEIVVGPNETVEMELPDLLRSGDAISTSAIASGQSGSANGYLGSYVGLYKTIHFSAIYCGNSGTVQCIFANTDGYNDSASCVITASNMNISKNIWGAHSGNYRLTVYNNSSADCAIACYW